MRYPRSAFVILLAIAPVVCWAQEQSAPDVKQDQLGGTRNVHACGKLFLAGQFNEADVAAIKSRGVKRVITLRQDDETNWDEKAAIVAAGLEHVSVPFAGPDSLTDEVINTVRELLHDTETATMLHCGSANRVGAVWWAYRALDQGVPLATALAEAKTVGLRNPGYEARVKEYITAELAKPKSVRPGINERFLDPKMDVREWIGRFELESREVYAERNAVLEACQLRPGIRVADVGAGTGLYTRLFASAVGKTGWVYAVDISPGFVQHIARRVKEDELTNVTTTLCAEDSIQLPPESIDLTFICDTYHHFEFPEQTLKSIHRALRPGGTLVVVDFERLPGKSREWLLNHVRAGKEVFRQEIETAGFGFVEEVEVDGLDENYLLRFRKR